MTWPNVLSLANDLATRFGLFLQLLVATAHPQHWSPSAFVPDVCQNFTTIGKMSFEFAA